MQPYQQRVVEEKRELDAKIDKLIPFIASSMYLKLDMAEQLRMKSQLEYMTAYSNVLGERIAAFSEVK